jgi:lipopolysaccharide transport system permease protein
MLETYDVVIRPPRSLARIDLPELWRYRFLLRSLMTRRIKAEFDQQTFAYVWPVFRPVLMVVLFTVFRGLSNAHTGVTIPYPLYVYAGLVLWFYFVESVQATATSLKANAGLIQKVYFPRVLAPISAIGANLCMFSVTVVPLVILMIWFGAGPGINLLILLPVLLQVVALIFGIGCIFAALGLGSGDWDKILAFALYIGLFVSPVIYDPGMMPDKARLFYSLNPIVGSLMGFRAALFDGMAFPWMEWLYSCAISALIMAAGLLMFQRAEKKIVDRL